MAVRDLKTEWIRVTGYRAMSPRRRTELAQGMMRTGRSTVAHAIRAQRPGLSGLEFELELWNRLYGRAWVNRVRELNRREGAPMEDWQVVAQVVSVLETNNIPYALVGGYSAIYWGRPRFTQDADLLVDLKRSQGDILLDALSDQFVVSRQAMQDAIRDHSEFNLIHQTQVYKADVWVSANEPYQVQVLKRRRQGMLGDLAVYYQSAEDTILSKLRWCKLSNFSEKQFNDALGVYEIQEPDLDQSYLDRWAKTLDVQELLTQVRTQAALPPNNE